MNAARRGFRAVHALRALGLVIFGYILWRIDRRQVLHLFRHSDHGLFLAAFALNVPVFWLKSQRWRTLVCRQHHPLRAADALMFHLGASFLGVVTPGRLGEFVKVLQLARQRICSPSQAFAGVLVDRLHDLYVLGMIGLWGVLAYVPGRWSRPLGWGGLALLGVLPVLFLLVPGWKRRGVALVARAAASRPASVFRLQAAEFAGDVETVLDHRLGSTLCLTAAAAALVFLQVRLIAAAVHLPLTYLEIVPLLALAELVNLLPVSIAGLGTREAVLFAVLLPRGLEAERIVLLSLGVFVVAYVGVALIGGVAWWVRSGAEPLLPPGGDEAEEEKR